MKSCWLTCQSGGQRRSHAFTLTLLQRWQFRVLPIQTTWTPQINPHPLFGVESAGTTLPPTAHRYSVASLQEGLHLSHKLVILLLCFFKEGRASSLSFEQTKISTLRKKERSIPDHPKVLQPFGFETKKIRVITVVWNKMLLIPKEAFQIFIRP